MVSYSTRAYPFRLKTLSENGLIRRNNTYFHITRPTVKVQMQVLNLSKLSKFILHILLCSLFVYVGHKNYPTFNSCPEIQNEWNEDRCEWLH